MDLNSITEKIIGASFEVSNNLGSGFLEKVYENALSKELTMMGLLAEQQKSISVEYKGTVVGEYYADLLVNSEIIVELKACKQLDENHSAQLMNYLKATNKKIGLLINFGNPKLQIKRMVNNF